MRSYSDISDQRGLFDRRAVMAALDDLAARDTDRVALRAGMIAKLKDALEAARTELARRLLERPSNGYEMAASNAFVVDQLVRCLHDFVIERLYPPGNRSAGERLAIVAVGGYGRGEMAPHSDVDIAFVTPGKRGAWAEQVVEAILYGLWDLGLVVGPSTRSIEETIRLARDDLSIRTALLESRFVWGDRPVYDAVDARLRAEVLAGPADEFVADKLAERDARHERMGDSRYVVEPNIKDGKGGLRDLHTLFWIGKYVHRVDSPAELVDAGLLTALEYRQFARAESWLWAVRCHLHTLAGRAEERLGFDYQKSVAERMRFANRRGKSAVERFMHFYFLNAKTVGDLTGVFLAQLDDQLGDKGRHFGSVDEPDAGELNGFVLDRGRLAVPSQDFFAGDPVRLLELFAIAQRHGLDIHPLTIRAARRDAKLIDRAVRWDARAARLFLEVLTDPQDPGTVLRAMNDAGVFGRFMPDFGRVVAQMQFDMYHHYTVDEHTITAISLLARIENGALKGDHPLSHALFNQIDSRRVLYVAVLLHDIAKGRSGDHSELGAELALRVCPRLGLTDSETETVSWLVRYHLLMSHTAFKRDIADPRTVRDFVGVVKSPERLRLLVMLTVVDIRAVGPGVWNDWKKQLLRDLYDAAEESLRLGHMERGREPRLAAKRAALTDALDWDGDAIDAYLARLPDSYLIAEPAEVLVANARQMEGMGPDDTRISARFDAPRGATLVTVCTADRAGLFYRVAGAISLAGANIIDARIHTLADGMVVDNFLVHDTGGQPLVEDHRLERVRDTIQSVLAGETDLDMALEARRPVSGPETAFHVVPVTHADNRASGRFTVIEVNARDRPALLSDLARALVAGGATLHSAHVATYGERAVDVFYITGAGGAKITDADALGEIRAALIAAARRGQEEAAA